MSFQVSDRNLDESHDPARRSWVESANETGTDFPVQNLPLGLFSPAGRAPRPGAAIGDRILDLAAVARLGLIAAPSEADASGGLNAWLAQGAGPSRALRRRLGSLLDAHGPEAGLLRQAEADVLHNAADCEMHRPARIGNFTDFFAGIHHARAAGAFMTPDNPLPRNYKWVPIAYHGRASSVRVSGEEIVRPTGQWMDPEASKPEFGPSRKLDIELELGMFVGTGNKLGKPIAVAEAGQHIYGYCLLNDWSARDLQFWEMFPLGPFLGKNFGTTISPWIVTSEAVRPFRVPAMHRPDGDPRPLDYLWDEDDQAQGDVAIALEVWFSTAAMREAGQPAEVVISSDARHLYWTPAQMVAHHTVGGCNLEPGDLIGSGTISGPTRGQLSSFLELTEAGSRPFSLSSGEPRTYLEDGDRVEFRGTCRRDGFASIGFGICAGQIAPAINS